MTRIPILMYHSIDSSGSVISISPDLFASHMELLHQRNFQVISLREAIQTLKEKGVTDRKVVLTFDDGFENFYTDAFPILAKYKMPSTIFLVTNYCGKTNDWPSQIKSIPILALLDWSRIQELSNFQVEVGAHSCTHPMLTRLSQECASREIKESQDTIQQKIGRRVPYFAYPYGDLNRTVRTIVAEHFESAVGTSLSETASEDDLYDLSRVDVYYLANRFHLIDSPFLSSYLAVRNCVRTLRPQRLLRRLAI
jgi:peptidoglycan/xylan/chitin deacetylase (PgdA/CDA1 family)